MNDARLDPHPFPFDGDDEKQVDGWDILFDSGKRGVGTVIFYSAHLVRR